MAYIFTVTGERLDSISNRHGLLSPALLHYSFVKDHWCSHQAQLAYLIIILAPADDVNQFIYYFLKVRISSDMTVLLAINILAT